VHLSAVTRPDVDIDSRCAYGEKEMNKHTRDLPSITLDHHHISKIQQCRRREP
jgi:hypothetical protein